MPLMKSKSPEAFKSNLKTEMSAGKPMKQSLAIAYSMKRKAKKMSDGGQTLGDAIGYPKKMADGGFVSEDSGYQVLPDATTNPNAEAMTETNKDLNQTYIEKFALGGEVVDRIMAKMGNKTNPIGMSEGGQVANGSMTEGLAGFEPNEFDDLVLRDDLDGGYTGENSGDENGNDQEDEDRADIVSRIMHSRGKKDRNPRPA